MRNILIILLSVLAFFSSSAFAQDTPPPPPVDVNTVSTFGGTTDQLNLVGVTCGVPGGLAGTNKCCVVSKDTTDQQSQILEAIPEYVCLPKAASGLLDLGAGLINDVFIDPFKEGIGFLTNVVTLDFKGAGGSALRLFVPDKVASGVKDALDDDNHCLSDAAVALSALTLSSLPTNSQEFQSMELPQTTCMEGATKFPPNVDATNPSCSCVFEVNAANVLCEKYLRGKEGLTGDYNACSDCANTGGYYTGIGCINASTPASFVGSILGIGLGIAGAMSLLCISYAAFVLQTSRGNPERIKKAKENLRACLTGLALIIFSVFLMRLIGVSILRIPGFN